MTGGAAAARSEEAPPSPPVEVGHQDIDRRASASCWFELAVVGVGVSAATVGVAGLALGLLDIYRTWAALAMGLPVAVLVLALLRRGWSFPLASAAVDRRHRDAGVAMALALAIAFTAFASLAPSQNVVVTRDPGSYANTALWLSQTGSLELEPGQGVFDRVDGLRYEGAAVYLTETGRIQFQFNHLTSVLLAVAHDVGGYRLMYRMPALAVGVGLLALYAVAARALRRPYVALLAPGLLAVAMPVLFVARNTYSEAFTLLLLWTAVLVAGSLHRRPGAGVGLAAGLLLGALVCIRVDALLYVALSVPLAAVSFLAGSPAQRRSRAVAFAVALPATVMVGAVGWIDLTTRSGGYASDIAPQLTQLRLALVGVGVLTASAVVAWLLLPALRRAAIRRRILLSTVGAVCVVVVLGAAWLLRPVVQTATADQPFSAVAVIQERDGLPMEPDRVYHEYSLWWMAWYLGIPALVAAIMGFGRSTQVVLRGVADPWLTITAALGLGAGALYWWNPSITPDHLWATRRFLPAVFPALAVMASFAVGQLLSLVEARSNLRPVRPVRPVRTAIAVVSAALVMVPPLVTSWPMRTQRDQGGYVHPVLEACEVIGPDGAVVVVGNHASLTLPQTIRSWCGVPVAAQGAAFEPDPIDSVVALAEMLEGRGRRLFLLAHTASDLAGYLEASPLDPRVTSEARDLWSPVPRLDGPPEAFRDPTTISPLPSPFALHLLEVPPR